MEVGGQGGPWLGLPGLGWNQKLPAAAGLWRLFLKASEFPWVGRLASERGSERQAPKETTALSTGEPLGLVAPRFRGEAWREARCGAIKTHQCSLLAVALCWRVVIKSIYFPLDGFLQLSLSKTRALYLTRQGHVLWKRLPGLVIAF